MTSANIGLPVPDHVPSELVIDFDMCADPGMKADLFKRLEEVRSNAPPIAYSPHNGGHWLIFRSEDIQTVLTQADRFSSSHINAAASEHGGPGMIPLGLDPPDNAVWRTLLHRHLGPTRVRKMERAIRAKAEELVSAVLGRTSVDFVKEIAEPMPITIFMELMGLPVERYPEFRSLAVRILDPDKIYDPACQAETAEANARIVSILSELITARRTEPRDDLVSALIGERVKGEPIGAAELMSICYVLFLGGLDTVTNAMSFGMRYLAQDPELQETVRKKPDVIPEVMENLLRRSAFVNTQRSVKCDTELNGVAMKKGDMVWNISWAGSNEAGSEQTGPHHFAFGAGYHVCIGMYLARLELRLLYETWFRMVGPFSLAPDPVPAMAGGPVMHIKRLMLNLASA